MSSPLLFSGGVSCLFSSSWYASLERRPEEFRKAADIGQNKLSSSKEDRKVMLAKGCKSELVSNYYWSRSSKKRPCEREPSKMSSGNIRKLEVSVGGSPADPDVSIREGKS